MGRTLRTAIVAAVAATALAVLAPAGLAQLPNQVTGVAVTQQEGFTTVTWTPVAGATDYQIERTPVDADNVPTGTATIRGLWRPNRQINNHLPSFADAGYFPGTRFQWRVRARFGTTTQPYSDPVFGTTLPSVGPADFLTSFETTASAPFTPYAEEIDWTARIAAASDRVRVVTIGQTPQGRNINLFVIGYPTPPANS